MTRGRWLLLALTACGGAQTRAGGEGPPRSADYFPLTEGSAWSYDIDDSVETVLAVSRVVERSGRRAVVTNPVGELITYEVRDDGIYRPEKHVYLLRDPLDLGADWSSAAGMSARVTALDRSVETPAGRFDHCLEVVEEGGEQGLRIVTTYAPRVGAVKIVAGMTLTGGRSAHTTALLRGFVIGE